MAGKDDKDKQPSYESNCKSSLKEKSVFDKFLPRIGIDIPIQSELLELE